MPSCSVMRGLSSDGWLVRGGGGRRRAHARRRRRARRAAPGWLRGRGRAAVAGLATPPGTSRVPGRRIGSPAALTGGARSRTRRPDRPAPSLPRPRRTARSPSVASALSQADRRALKIGVSASPRSRPSAGTPAYRARHPDRDDACRGRAAGAASGCSSSAAAQRRALASERSSQPGRRRVRPRRLVRAACGGRSRRRRRWAPGRRRGRSVAASQPVVRGSASGHRRRRGAVVALRRCSGSTALAAAATTACAGRGVPALGGGATGCQRRRGSGETARPPSCRRGGCAARETVMPCRWASRLTTNRPIRRAVSGVTSPPARRVSLMSARASVGDAEAGVLDLDRARRSGAARGAELAPWSSGPSRPARCRPAR